MAAPSATARQTPTGRMLGRHSPTLITFSLEPDLAVEEISVTPSSYMMDSPIDMSSMFSGELHAQLPAEAYKIGPVKITAKYDPAAFATLLSILGINQTITTSYPDGTTEAAFGWIQGITKGQLQKGQTTPPTMDIDVEISNVDPGTCDVQAPVLTAGAGTACI